MLPVLIEGTFAFQLKVSDDKDVVFFLIQVLIQSQELQTPGSELLVRSRMIEDSEYLLDAHYVPWPCSVI